MRNQFHHCSFLFFCLAAASFTSIKFGFILFCCRSRNLLSYVKMKTRLCKIRVICISGILVLLRHHYHQVFISWQPKFALNMPNAVSLTNKDSHLHEQGLGLGSNILTWKFQSNIEIGKYTKKNKKSYLQGEIREIRINYFTIKKIERWSNWNFQNN